MPRVELNVYTVPWVTCAFQNDYYFEFDARTDRKVRPPFSSL